MTKDILLRQRIQALELIEKKYTALKERIHQLGDVVNESLHADQLTPADN